MADVMTGQLTLEKLYQDAQTLVPKFFQLWEEIGYDSNTINIYSQDIIKNTHSLWLEMLQEIETKKYSLVKKVESLYKQISSLEEKLGMDAMLVGYENQSLIVLEEKLKNHLDNLEDIEEKRLTEVRVLLEKERELCESLGEQPVGMTKSLPDEEELESFSIYLSEKESKLHNVRKNFEKIRKSIMEIMTEMSYTPKYDFERLVCHGHQDFVFSSSNMKKLEELRDNLKEELINMKETAEKKRQELINLWRYLDIPEESYQEFLEKHSGFDSSTISALNNEIADCKEVRMKNIAQFLQKLREDLKTWWDICKFSETQRNLFRPMTYETLTEDILTLHEHELARVQKFYKDNIAIYELLNKRDEIWEQMKELDRRAEDPDRFYNRGGQLLADEKIRKNNNKNLPKIDAQLAKLTEEYEEKKCKPFTINGLSIKEYVQKQMDEHKTQMEELKQERAKAKEEKKSAKKTPLSASRRTPRMTTSIRVAQTSLKRKPLDRSPLSTLNKAPRMANSENSRPRVHGSKIRRSGRVARKLLGSSFNKSKSPTKSFNKTKAIDSTVSIASSHNENHLYKEFKEYLGDKDELRSTIGPSENNTSVTKLKKKPVKTPVKPTRKYASPVTPRVTPRYLRAPDASRSPIISSTPRFVAAPSNCQTKF